MIKKIFFLISIFIFFIFISSCYLYPLFNLNNNDSNSMICIFIDNFSNVLNEISNIYETSEDISYYNIYLNDIYFKVYSNFFYIKNIKEGIYRLYITHPCFENSIINLYLPIETNIKVNKNENLTLNLHFKYKYAKTIISSNNASFTSNLLNNTSSSATIDSAGGEIIVDMGCDNAMEDKDSYDFKIKGSNYIISVSTSPTGGWVSVLPAYTDDGVSYFDLEDAGVSEARYIRFENVIDKKASITYIELLH